MPTLRLALLALLALIGACSFQPGTLPTPAASLGAAMFFATVPATYQYAFVLTIGGS